MVYQGSKNKLAKYIVPIIQKAIDEQNTTQYIELFVGGANMIDKIKCKRKIGVDVNQPLIKLLKYAQTDPEIKIAPKECSFEHYKDVRENQNTGKYSTEYVALIGYMASYGGRYFDGGYGRDAKGGRSIYAERLQNLKDQAPALKGIEFMCSDYQDIDITQITGAVIYLDPPYRDTKKYTNQKMNYDEFYDFCKEAAKRNTVFISEYEMPSDDFEVVWEKERKVLQKSDRIQGEKAIERLYRCR